MSAFLIIVGQYPNQTDPDGLRKVAFRHGAKLALATDCLRVGHRLKRGPGRPAIVVTADDLDVDAKSENQEIRTSLPVYNNCASAIKCRK